MIGQGRANRMKEVTKLKRRWICSGIIILLIFPLTGCWDANEPEKLVYVHGIGLDYQKGKYTIYVQLINLSLMAKSNSGAGNPSIVSEIGNASGDSVEAAIYNLYKTSQRRIYWGHLTYMVLTNDVLKHTGLQAISDILGRYFESHYHIWVYNTQKPIKDVLRTLPNNSMSSDLSRLSDPAASFDQFSFVHPLDLREVIVYSNEPPHEMVIPLVSNSTNHWEGNKKPRNVATLQGLSVITNQTLKGNITDNDASGFRWMDPNFRRTGLSLKSKNHTNLGVTVKKLKVKIIPNTKKSKTEFVVNIKGKAVVNRLEKMIATSLIEQEVERVIKKEILRTYQKGLEIDSDLYGLSNILYKDNFPIWKKIQKNGKIPLDKDTIKKVNVQIMVLDGGKQNNVPTLK